MKREFLRKVFRSRCGDYSIFENENNLPIDIITGLSEPMKIIVFEVLDEYGFDYVEIFLTRDI